MSELFLPALHGVMGSRHYYSVVMSLSEVAERVEYAQEVHNSEKLSEFIQRRLSLGRAKKIADYLTNNSERFFSSLVVAVYGGDPLWYDAGDIRFSKSADIEPAAVRSAGNRMGFLRFDGTERIFALDGQHRLAGIRRAVKRDKSVAEDLVSVLFIGHKNTTPGRIRTRRLFTVLNKHAKPVSKADIIALDEDDASAIVTRKLVEDGGLFSGNIISYSSTNQLADSDRNSLTTILTLYDSVKIIISKTPHSALDEIRQSAKTFERPSTRALDKTYNTVNKFFQKMIAEYDDLSEYFECTNRQRRVGKFRHRRGGNILFRPVGFSMFVQLIVDLMNSGGSLKSAITTATGLPLNLTKSPYRHLLWLPESSRMNVKQKATVTDILRITCGLSVSDKRIDTITRTANDAYGYMPNSENYFTVTSLREYAQSLSSGG